MVSIANLARRSLRTLSKKQEFSALMRANSLTLDFEPNRNAMGAIREIFGEREYSGWFPFYENANIVDVGAHYGFFSMFAALNTGPGARIVALEPSSENLRILNANLDRSGLKKVNTIRGALGRKDGTAKLALGDSVNNSTVEAVHASDRVEIVPAFSLETLFNSNGLERVDFLKMDCEGAEYEAMEETPRRVFDRITTISMEFHDLKDPKYSPNWLAARFFANGFEVKKFEYSSTGIGKNYGKMIASKLLMG